MPFIQTQFFVAQYPQKLHSEPQVHTVMKRMSAGRVRVLTNNCMNKWLGNQFRVSDFLEKAFSGNLLIQLKSDQTAQLLNKPYENEGILKRAKPILKMLPAS